VGLSAVPKGSPEYRHEAAREELNPAPRRPTWVEMSQAIEASTPARDFDALIGPYIEPGYRLAVTLLLDPDEARDAVQEAAIKAWRSLGRLRDPSQSRPWFLSIVANHCRSTMRRRWWSLGRNPLGAVRVDWPEDRVARSLDIDAGMKRLSPEDRAVLHLHFYQDLPLDEVGRVLGISTGAARSRVYRAAKRLRPNLTEEDIR
jgi:RNA polymerase sigma-70 factor, ECF subfamily